MEHKWMWEMAAGHDQATEGQEAVRSPIRRRGILAVAAAAVAGIVAKQTSQPMQAVGGFAQTNFTATGTINPGIGFDASAIAFTIGVLGNGINTGGVGVRGSVANLGYGVYGKAGNGGANGTATGVFGETDGDGVSKGVHGKTAIGYGVYGEATANGGYGVTGIATNTFGVIGSSGSGTGVQGSSTSATGVVGTGATGVFGSGTSIGISGLSNSISGTGVKGSSASGFPIIGQVTGGTSANAGVLGTGTAGPGAQGQSTGGHGLVGTTAATDGHAGLIGYASAPNGIGLRGSAANGATLAGVFDGDVSISGALRVYGAPKSAAVKHPDGSHRLLYCMESPESWFEDFGEGTLVNGKADVALDRDFAALVDTGRLHVFPVAHDEHHLHVAQRTASGFTVAATPSAAAHAAGKKAGDLGGTFSYRVVARRKDIKGERLAKVEPPPALKVPTTFTVPETPAIKAPEVPKKP